MLERLRWRKGSAYRFLLLAVATIICSAGTTEASGPVYCGPEMAALQRLTPTGPVLLLSGLATTANGIIAVVSAKGEDQFSAEEMGGWAIATIGSAIGFIAMVDRCVETSPEKLESCGGCFVREAPQDVNLRRKYVRDQRRGTLVALSLNLLLSSAAYAIAQEGYRDAIAWVTLGGSVLPSLFYIRRYFASVPAGEATLDGRGSQSGTTAGPSHFGLNVGISSGGRAEVQGRLTVGF